MKMLLAALAAIAATASADAALLRFSFTGAADYSFRIESNPVPDRRVDGIEADFYDVPGAFGPRTKADVYLFTSPFGGGLVLNDFGGTGVFLNASGPQLFAGTVAAPVLATGNFDLVTSAGESLRLNVAAVPEPATWISLAIGLGAVGSVVRRRRRTSTVSASA